MPRARAMLVCGFACSVSCGGGGDARYPSRDVGCPVRTYPAASPIAEDELGPVRVTCRAGTQTCERQLLDAVCARGGDVAWGLGDNALTATELAAHAAHSRRAREANRRAGCEVRVYDPAPTIPTENVGSVAAFCSQDDSREVCLRELEDQVCAVGGDVLWQIEGPSIQGDKMRMRGRAAHSK